MKGISHKKVMWRPGLKDVASALALGVASLTLTITVATPAHAQESTASLRGTITVEGGASQVTAIDVNSGVTRTAVVAPDGSYNFPSLRPGTYRLEVTTPSGVRRTDEFTLLVAQNAVLDFDLPAPTPPAEAGAPAADSAIVVVGQRLRTMEGGEVGTNITQRLIEQLPQNNRNFLAFAELAPGVIFSTDGQGNTALRGGAAPTASINVFIDGVSQKDNVLKNGVTGQDSTQGNPFPQLAIGEYRVISSNYKAEFDEVSSVAITAVTKSGTNEFHGDAFVDYSNEKLRARIPTELSGEKIKTKDFQFGAALGGPIIRDMLHFFASYEGKRRRNPVDIFPGLDRDVSIFPEEYQGFFGPTNNEFNEDLYFGKISFSPTDKDLFEFSGKHRNESGFNLGSGQTAAEAVSSNDVTEWRGLARWEHIEDNWINDLKISYEDVSWAPRPQSDEIGIQLEYDGPNPANPAQNQRGTLLVIGGSPNFQDKGQKGWTIQNDFTWIGFEGHTIKAGIKAKWINLNSTQLNFSNPRYYFNTAFPDPSGFNDTIPYRVEMGAVSGEGDPTVESDNFQLGLYIQDDWDVTDRLTLNLGIRWDYEHNPEFLNFEHDQRRVDMVTGVTLNAMGNPAYPNLANADYDIHDYISTGSEREAFLGAFQPRIGFTYELDESGHFQIFGGYGRSYDRNRFDFLQQEISRGSFEVVNFRFPGDPENNCSPSPTPTCLPWDPIYLTEAGRQQLLDGLAAIGGGGEFRFINNDLKTPYSDQFSLGVRNRWGLLSGELGFNYIAYRDGFVWLLGNRHPDGSFFLPDNPGSATDTPGSPFGAAPPGFGSIIIGDNGAETTTKSVYLKMTKAYTRSSPWSFDATYTYSDAEENRNTTDTGAFSLDFPTMDDYPVVHALGVPKHRFIAAGSIDLPWDFTFSAKFELYSPLPVRALVGTAVPYDRTVETAFSKGNGDRWGKRQMDVAMTKYIPLSFINDQARMRFRVDIINLFNDRNYTNFVSNPSDVNYRERSGLSVGGNPPRTFKLTTGFSF